VVFDETSPQLRVLATALAVAAVAVGGWAVRGLAEPDPSAAPGKPRDLHLVAADSSGSGNHGVNQGRPALGEAGYRGTSYGFGLRGAWVQVPSNDSLNPGRHDFAVSAWINLDETPGVGKSFDIVRKGLSWGSGDFKLEVIPGGRVKCSINDDAGATGWAIERNIDVADGRWHRVGCARVGNTWSVVVDGNVTTNVVGLRSIANAMPLSIGAKYGQSDMTQGRVDEVSYVIAENARSGHPGNRPRAAVVRELLDGDPVGLWHLDESPSGTQQQ
jgi:hypothetical protein